MNTVTINHTSNNNTDPLYILDRWFKTLYNTKYPDQSSILLDPLRGSLSRIFDVNLNMYDTHRFNCPPYERTFFIYEGESEIDSLKDLRMEGVYPEGVFLGFLDANFRDLDYRKDHQSEFFDNILRIARMFIKCAYPYKLTYNKRYSEYLASVPRIFATLICAGLYAHGCSAELLSATKNFDYSEVCKYLQEYAKSSEEDEEEEMRAVEQPKTISNESSGSRKKFHVFFFNPFIDSDYSDAAICTDMYTTKHQLDIGANIILTTCTSFLTMDLLRSYDVYIHTDIEKVYPVKLGENYWSDKILRPQHNLEKFVIDALFEK